jgi:hypothetical protein
MHAPKRVIWVTKRRLWCAHKRRRGWVIRQTAVLSDKQPVSFLHRFYVNIDASNHGTARHKGIVMEQGLELSIWLGMPALALVSAQILLWRTRRVLSRSPQARVPAVKVPAVKLVSSCPEVRRVPAAVTESAGSAVAS